jgi:hypothetical protein
MKTPERKLKGEGESRRGMNEGMEAWERMRRSVKDRNGKLKIEEKGRNREKGRKPSRARTT